MVRVMLALCALLALATAGADTPVVCDSKTNGGDYFEIRCPLLADERAEWLFRASFTGVHDDSAARIAVSIDGAAVACGPGSKLELLGLGDEGSAGSDGFIECRLALERGASGERRLLVVLTWKHAQHVGHELVSVPRG
jgi:hypothetical protein